MSDQSINHSWTQSQYWLAFSLLFLVFCSFKASANPTKVHLQKFEYAIFYVETEGDFVVPVEVDAPFVYSWSEPRGSVKGEISDIWRFLKIKTEIQYSYSEIESTLINHVASKGWELHDLEITSVPLPNGSVRFRTAYRYIFKRSI